jgi:hypothetical protein
MDSADPTTDMREAFAHSVTEAATRWRIGTDSFEREHEDHGWRCSDDGWLLAMKCRVM